MRPPEFWHRPGGLAPALLAPFGAAYGALGALYALRARPWPAPVPVICIGNPVAGGAGKTPTALAIAAHLQKADLRVAFLSRGYGGRLKGPIEVDPARHIARDVGDEPLLLAARAPTWVARDRKDGARVAIAEGADLVIMDDGLQNPTLRKDASLVVVDGGYGFGNRRVMPAGPLREPLARGLARASALVLVGEDETNLAGELARHAPVLRARLVPDAEARRLKNKRVLAFAGIGRPEKFFRTLSELGAEVTDAHAFADHHSYASDEIMRLVEDAAQRQATPVTTANDHVRLPPEARAMVTAVRVDLVFDDIEALDRALRPALDRLVRAPPHG
ncbi:MAG: tetraacyldisaccharide 4'-kinase [Rhodospirillales bacterium]|nr:tetraacyldisaccharide 4'-kinase [Rhodospirillales bacterium]